jgi:hypothetical protein
MKKPKEKKLIGRMEVVDFPELGLLHIDAKIDTGAYTSSIHCKNVKPVKKGEEDYVSFNLLDHTHPLYHKKSFLLPVHKQKTVKNSFGQTQTRFVIKTKIMLLDKTYDIELALADRSKMDFPVLLGRRLLRRGFIVDVSKKYLSTKNIKKKGTEQ